MGSVMDYVSNEKIIGKLTVNSIEFSAPYINFRSDLKIDFTLPDEFQILGQPRIYIRFPKIFDNTLLLLHQTQCNLMRKFDNFPVGGNCKYFKGLLILETSTEFSLISNNFIIEISPINMADRKYPADGSVE